LGVVGLKDLILAQPLPKLVELRLKTVHEFTVVGDDNIFVVLGGGGACPVVTAGEEKIVVGDSELVVHVCGGAVETAVNASASEVVEVGAEVLGFVVIGNDANADLTGVGFFEFLGNTVISDGEDTDVERLACFADETADAMKAIFAGAEVGARLNFVFFGVEEFNDVLKPVECGDLAELADCVVGQTKSELPGLGQPDGIASDFGEMDFESLPLGPAEGKVLK